MFQITFQVGVDGMEVQRWQHDKLKSRGHQVKRNYGGEGQFDFTKDEFD